MEWQLMRFLLTLKLGRGLHGGGVETLHARSQQLLLGYWMHSILWGQQKFPRMLVSLLLRKFCLFVGLYKVLNVQTLWQPLACSLGSGSEDPFWKHGGWLWWWWSWWFFFQRQWQQYVLLWWNWLSEPWWLSFLGFCKNSGLNWGKFFFMPSLRCRRSKIAWFHCLSHGWVDHPGGAGSRKCFLLLHTLMCNRLQLAKYLSTNNNKTRILRTNQKPNFSP